MEVLISTLKEMVSFIKDWGALIIAGISLLIAIISLFKSSKAYLFTSNLKELSGAMLHKMVFAFRLAYIIEIEKYLGIKLPIILDSPSGKEVDPSNVERMINILKRDFSGNQIIIASIFNYNFETVNIIELSNRLIDG